MAGRIGASTRDGVRTVRTVRADGVDEFTALGERFAERASQRGSLSLVQLVGAPTERDDDCVAFDTDRYFIAGEFPDQERGDSVTYVLMYRSSLKILSVSGPLRRYLVSKIFGCISPLGTER